MRLLLDTNVVASAMLWGGNPLLLLQARREGRIELCTSTPLLAVREYQGIRIVSVAEALGIVRAKA
ncbi:MAG: hypothetical protein Q8O25_15375 [Sulfurisoma sp.]|nr:hypothetical protein [Sulfurisoma sp.]